MRLGQQRAQYYRPENVTVSGGVLRITAKQENYGGMPYTSGRIRTAGLADWAYGRFEVRAKLPKGQGLWPAIWMLPTDWVYGGWAASGEIDIMELVGHEPNRVHGTLHYGEPYPNNTSSGASYAPERRSATPSTPSRSSGSPPRSAGTWTTCTT